jgi:hypothetical protein
MALVLAGSAAAWVILFALLPPTQQDFPLGDDWAFSQGAWSFAATGEIHYRNWASIPQLGQWLWAWPFLRLFGESHVALRISTIVLSWFGLWAFGDLLGQEGVALGRAAFLVATLALNPLFFLMQGTFMTDVPALSFALIALALYTRAIRHGQGLVLAIAAAVAVLGALTRQNTLATPLAAGVLLVREPHVRRRPAWLLGVLLPLVVGVGTHVWFHGRPDAVSPPPAPQVPVIVVLIPFVIFHYGGLAALPALLLVPRYGSWRTFALALAAMALGTFYWWGLGKELPYGGLFPYCPGLLGTHGPFAGSLELGEQPEQLGWTMRLVLTVAGCIAGAELLTRLIDVHRSGLGTGPIMLFTGLQLPMLLVAYGFYDRYLLFLLPGTLLVAAGAEPKARPRWLPGLLALGMFAAISTAIMHDWLSWNSARWRLGERVATRDHIAATDIEGGLEWNGWFAPEPRPVTHTPTPRGLALPFTFTFFPHVKGACALSFSPLPGTVVVDSEPYSLWLSPGKHRFFFLRLPDGAAKDGVKESG